MHEGNRHIVWGRQRGKENIKALKCSRAKVLETCPVKIKGGYKEGRD